MRMLTTTVLAIALFGIPAAPALAQGTKPDPKLIQLGEKLYVQHKCMMCHSIAGKGNKAGALDDVGSRLSEEDIRQWMINPRVMTEKTKSTRKPIMPAYPKMSKDDLDAVVAYMKSLTGKPK